MSSETYVTWMKLDHLEFLKDIFKLRDCKFSWMAFNKTDKLGDHVRYHFTFSVSRPSNEFRVSPPMNEKQ